jgi:hypothetical protein
MLSKPDSDPEAYVFSSDQTLTAGQAGRFCTAPVATWLATVVLVLIVIGVALSVAAWREHKKKSTAAGAEILTSSAPETVLVGRLRDPRGGEPDSCSAFVTTFISAG